MRQRPLIYIFFMSSLFLLTMVYFSFYELSVLNLWLGGIIGLFLPYIDHFLFSYITFPDDAYAVDFRNQVKNKNFKGVFFNMTKTKEDRKDLLFHSAFFQLAFVVFAFLVVTSTGSLLGRGLVIAFLLHLLLDQIMDVREKKPLAWWFRNLSLPFDGEQRRWYLVFNGLIIVLLSFFF